MRILARVVHYVDSKNPRQMEDRRPMLRKILTFAVLIMFACAATAVYSLTYSDGFESGNLSDEWIVVGSDPPAGDAIVKHQSQGAIVRTGQYSMFMYANGVDEGKRAWWPNLVFGDDIPRDGNFEAWLRLDDKAGVPQLWLEATYTIEGFEELNGFLAPIPSDTNWHKYSIFYDPDYDADNGRLTAFYDGGSCGSFVSEDLKGGQFSGGGFSIVTGGGGGGRLKYWLDDCGIYVAPEPSSMMALGCGLFGLAGLALKRRR